MKNKLAIWLKIYDAMKTDSIKYVIWNEYGRWIKLEWEIRWSIDQKKTNFLKRPIQFRMMQYFENGLYNAS